MKIFKNLRKAYREERKYRDNVMETIDAMGIRGIFMAMFTGKYPYEQNIKEYVPLIKSYEGETLFDKARKLAPAATYDKNNK